MQYLVPYLDGSAKQLVSSFPISDANYQDAWEALTNHYDKKKYTLIREFMDQPAVSTATSGSLRKLVTTSDEVVRQLNALGEDYGTRDPWLIYFLLEKLDKESRSMWAQQIIEEKNPSFDDFIKFLDNRCDALETCTAFTKKITTEAVKKEPSKKLASEKRMQSLHTAARHHTLLCELKSEDGKKKPVENSDSDQQQAGEAAITSMVAQVPLEPQQKSVVLPTAVIREQGFDGGLLQVRALIDSDSEASLISEVCVKKLGLSCSNGKVTAAGTTRGLVKLVMANRFIDVCVLQTSAYVLGKLTSTLPTQHCRVHSSLLDKQLKENLADPAYYQPGPIDIILGSDVFLALLKPGQVKNNGGVPVAQNTIFGWIVSGNQAIYSSSLRSNVSIVNLHTELDLNRTLRMFWEQEEVPKPQQLTPSAQAATELFRSTLTRDENGRFIVRLLFDDSKPALGESLTSATKRLRSMKRRFRQDEEFHSLYSEFLSEYLAQGHMEEVPPDELEVETSKCFYLPHHAVVKAESTTTKLRVVFDASCASSTADVEKMYRQDYLRIVFRESEDQPIKHYRLCTVTYETKCAPYLALEAMKQVAREYNQVYPEAVQRIELDTYVDDFLFGAQTTVQQARKFKEQVVEILESAGFHLRKWTTNCSELLQEAPEDDQAPVDVKLAEQLDAVKALGIQWLPKEDTFSFKVSLNPNSVNTKRQLLSDSCKLFDPFGWLSPVTVRVKILFQQLWLTDLAWDDWLPPAVEPA
ncbi:uncharacterized protein LOC135699294 [Ochlerotatus camptorhynchus]|uniref:uncharacterized protein LOC135699294 n=1 Tax=Ochlerotatus camptorhynchus TaxID=644619 RepID=UPI0031D7FA5C